MRLFGRKEAAHEEVRLYIYRTCFSYGPEICQFGMDDEAQADSYKPSQMEDSHGKAKGSL